jgi:hypothetical protein
MAFTRNPAKQLFPSLILPNLFGAIVNVCSASVVEYFPIWRVTFIQIGTRICKISIFNSGFQIRVFCVDTARHLLNRYWLFENTSNLLNVSIIKTKWINQTGSLIYFDVVWEVDENFWILRMCLCWHGKWVRCVGFSFGNFPFQNYKYSWSLLPAQTV